jgi:hypothetical protein
MCDELANEDLVGKDSALSSSIRRKWPDAWAVQWGVTPSRGVRWIVFILEFTRPNDGADDWRARTDACGGSLRGKAPYRNTNC